MSDFLSFVMICTTAVAVSVVAGLLVFVFKQGGNNGRN